MNESTISEKVTAVIADGLSYCRETRQCQSFDDFNFLSTGLTRVIECHSSGREFLQTIKEDPSEDDLARTTYFSSLHSERRRDLAAECEAVIYQKFCSEFKSKGIDHLKKFKDLDGYNIIAYDGHFHKHACHAQRDSNGKRRAVGGIYGMNLRYGLVQRIITTDFGISKTHEMKAFKAKFSIEEAQRTRKTISVLDMAYMDGPFWSKCKSMRGMGIYIITLMKDKLNPIKETPLEFDTEHPYNVGIQSQSEVTFESGAIFRKIIYIDPETETERTYLTTVRDVHPGLIAYLYLWRWKIEKLFDVFKNKLYERKAWANGKVSADTQSSMIAMAYNILLSTQKISLGDLGITEEKLMKKQRDCLESRRKKAKANGRKLHPLAEIPHKLFQMSAQFIRCFRNGMRWETPWVDAIPLFRESMIKFL
jgi:hypothetical protein